MERDELGKEFGRYGADLGHLDPQFTPLFVQRCQCAARHGAPVLSEASEPVHLDAGDLDQWPHRRIVLVGAEEVQEQVFRLAWGGIRMLDEDRAEAAPRLSGDDHA